MFSSAATTTPSRTVTLSAPSPSTRVMAPMRIVRGSDTSRLLLLRRIDRAEFWRVGVEVVEQAREVARVVPVGAVANAEADEVRLLLRAEAPEALAVVAWADHLAADLRHRPQARDAL